MITLESSKLDTPVIGLVTEDVWHNGELIIPASAEVHGRASLDRARERIAASGKWVIVWRDSTPLNGTELVVSGIALDRQKDDTNGEFGLRDGSAGFLGNLIKSDNYQEVKMFAGTFLAGVASGMQQLRNQGTAFGDIVQVPSVSGRNAALQGTADVLNAYARQIQEAIARDGFQSLAGLIRRQEFVYLRPRHRRPRAMTDVEHMHRSLVNRENHAIAPVPPAINQLAQFALEHPVFARSRAPLRKPRERKNFGFDRVEPSFGRIRRLRRNPSRRLVDVPNGPRLDDDAIFHRAGLNPCFRRSRAKTVSAGSPWPRAMDARPSAMPACACMASTPSIIA